MTEYVANTKFNLKSMYTLEINSVFTLFIFYTTKFFAIILFLDTILEKLFYKSLKDTLRIVQLHNIILQNIKYLQ